MGPPSHAAQGNSLTLLDSTVSADLVARARGGDDRAFEDLVRATYAEAYALALRMTGDEHDARDAVQEAFLRAYRSIEKFRGDSSFSTWLHRITANCVSSALERKGSTAAQTLDTVVPPDRELSLTDHRSEHDPEARSVERAERERLVAALGQLPDRLRAVLVLRDIYDLPHEAIAHELGITTTAAKVRLHRARRQLRQSLYRSSTPQPPELSPVETWPQRSRCPVRCEDVATALPRVLEGTRRADRRVISHVESCLHCQAELAR